ncbi:MAG: carboxypeptidase regulatory-like domain-containing protein [Planctomycetota bacterium]
MHRLFSIAIIFLTACSTASEPVPIEHAFETAVERARSSDGDGALAALLTALENDPAACQRALLEPAFRSGLRDDDAFRDAIRDAAVRHGISALALAPEDEPGEWIEIEGRVIDEEDAPVAGAVVRIFATDTEGRYHPTIEGERVPRLFGTMVTDDEGRFTCRTVRPGPYPGTRQARHIHMAVDADGKRLTRPHYAVFDDDPLLEEPQNAEQRGEAIRIAMSKEGDRSIGTLILPVR